MEEVYSAADFTVARAGAASLAEIASFELPSLLIPFPYAADDHQTRNAEIFARAGAAFVLKESELTPELLTQKIRDMIDRPEQLRRMSEGCSHLAPRDAANRVAVTMEKYTQS
jgi:UDP-N-acetylglucosamine--N-acetylmuramyl-(pentapeptide) pyrophosphoryl-undecaprenol N-acetylglucosamine transferase